MHKILLFVIVTIVVILSISKSTAQNLVTNPGFENNLTGWVSFSTDTPATSVSVDNSTSVSGSYSLAITVRDTGTITAGVLQTISVIPGHHYLLSAYVKTDSVIGNALPFVNLGDSIELFEYGLLPSFNTSPWRIQQSRIIAPPRVTHFTIFLFLQGLSGSAHFDDISFTDITDSSVSAFSVRPDSVTGTIRSFLATNVGPVNRIPANLTQQFEQLEIQDVRTHDYYGPCDLHTLFPDTSRDPLDSTAYNFGSTDSVIGPIVACGAQVYFRLGESYVIPMLYGNPPANFTKTAQVFVQIIKHYNAGWDKGFNYNIKEWEIWNEPDGLFFWNGPPQSYASFYRVVATAIKRYDSTLLVGGPAVASLYSSAFLSTFLDTIAAEHVPLDFFSYHFYYLANPYNYIQYDSMAIKWMDLYGLGSVKRYMSEWNNYTYSAADSPDIWRDDPFIACQEVSTIAYLQQTSLSKAFHYRTNEYYFGLFDNSGNYTYLGLGYRTISAFKTDDQKLQTSGSDSLGKTIMAGKNQTGDSMNIVISDNSSQASSYYITFNGLAASDSFNYQIYRIDSTHLYQLYQTGGINHLNDTISAKANPPFIDQILLQKVASTTGIVSIAAEGLHIYPNPMSTEAKIVLSNPSGIPTVVTLYDLSGRIISTQSYTDDKSILLERNQLVSGLYLVEVKQQNQRIGIAKIVVE